MEQFARVLSGITGRPVFDKAGISGIFDIDFDAESAGHWTGGEQWRATPIPLLGASLIRFKAATGKSRVKHLLVDSALTAPAKN